MQLVKLLVVDRKGIEGNMTRGQFIYVLQLSEVSSILVRDTADQNELAVHLNLAVLDYTVQHRLYAFGTAPNYRDGRDISR